MALEGARVKTIAAQLKGGFDELEIVAGHRRATHGVGLGVEEAGLDELAHERGGNLGLCRHLVDGVICLGKCVVFGLGGLLCGLLRISVAVKDAQICIGRRVKLFLDDSQGIELRLLHLEDGLETRNVVVRVHAVAALGALRRNKALALQETHLRHRDVGMVDLELFDDLADSVLGFIRHRVCSPTGTRRLLSAC